MRSTLPTEANQDSPELGLLVERALTQTAERGGTYAVVPVPWARCWWDITVMSGVTCFPWYEYCGVHEPGQERIREQWDFSYAQVDGEGNFLVCLLPPGHEGDCGYEFLL